MKETIYLSSCLNVEVPPSGGHATDLWCHLWFECETSYNAHQLSQVEIMFAKCVAYDNKQVFSSHKENEMQIKDRRHSKVKCLWIISSQMQF